MSIQFRTRSRGFNVDPTTLSGACCSSTNCTDLTLATCHVDSDFYAGQNCKDNPCVVGAKSRSLYGVCCDNNGFCDITTEEGCDCRNGTWKGNDFDCLSYDCCAGTTASLQACCMGSYIKGSSGDYSWAGLCKDLKPCECLEVGGVPRGPLSTCSEINGVGGCGVTGATAYGSCCTTGNCLSPDDKGYPNGYTAGDCAVLGGLWGGSGSACNDGTTFSNSWPCSWPTGSCCFGHQPYNGITYCDSGKTCGDCLNQPPGGSGGMAWVGGATCGTLKDINGISCIVPSGLDSGTCCIPEYFGVEDADTEAFVVDYKCYVTSENRCIGLGGLWNNEKSNCDDIECCSQYGDCTFGDGGACCQFNISSGEFIQCDSTTIYHCEQIALNNKNITTLFHKGEDCNEETGYPCKDAIFTTDSCCLWQQDGVYIGCQNIGENDECPPTDVYIGVRFDQPCESPGFNCAVQEMGACCYGSMCSFTSRGQCIDLRGVFYEELNCLNDCEVLPCCSSVTNPVITGYNKHNESISRHGADGCLDSFSVSSHTDKEFASDYLIDLGVNNPDAVRSLANQEFDSCEDCDCAFSRSRGSCCLGTECVPNYTQDECIAMGGTFLGCSGKPFENISQSWMTDNPCLEMGCAEQALLGQDDCGESEGCFGACCSGGGDDDPCPPGGSCTDGVLEDACAGCFYGCDTTCCAVDPPTDLACCVGGVCVDMDADNAEEQCIQQGGVSQGYGTVCEELHDSACNSGLDGRCCIAADPDGPKGDLPIEGFCSIEGKNDCFWYGGCWDNANFCCDVLDDNGEPDPTCIDCKALGKDGLPTDCNEFGGENDLWGDKAVWGACCDSYTLTCEEMDYYDSLATCTGDNKTWNQGVHCNEGCGGCVARDCTDPCPDCRPCCIQEGAHGDEKTGRYVCEDMLPDDCINIAGTPQCNAGGSKCSDFAIKVCDDDDENCTSYNQGQYLCNYCGFKAHEFSIEEDGSGDYEVFNGATTLGASCRACCSGNCEDDYCCHALPTYQDHIDAEIGDPYNSNCISEHGDWDSCFISITSNLDEYNHPQPEPDDVRPRCGWHSDEWCTNCRCSGRGACCGHSCFDTQQNPDWGYSSCIDGVTREDCANADACNYGTCGNAVFMGPGSVCSAHPDDWVEFETFCNANMAPCCTCNNLPVSWGQSEPDSWCEPCPGDEPGNDCSQDCGIATDCNCCGNEKGPGKSDPPWTGTFCTMISKFDIDNPPGGQDFACRNRDGTEGHIGAFGEHCEGGAYGDSCHTCDGGDFGTGPCVSVHRYAQLYPHTKVSYGDDDIGEDMIGYLEDEGGGPGSYSNIYFMASPWYHPACMVMGKNECDMKNHSGGCSNNWDGTPGTLWKYPECNSYPGVHWMPGSATGQDTEWENNELGPKWTWWGPHGNEAASGDDCEAWSRGRNRGAVWGQICSSQSRPYNYLLDRGWNPYSFCYGTMTNSYPSPGNDKGGNAMHGNKSTLHRDWSTPWCHPRWDMDDDCRSQTAGGVQLNGFGLFGNNDEKDEYYNKGTPLKQAGLCNGRGHLCGTGCPNCRLITHAPGSGDTDPQSCRSNSHSVITLAQGQEWTEDGGYCKESCKTFGACCNPMNGGACSAWPEHECLLLGGFYLGDYPCTSFGCPACSSCVEHQYPYPQPWRPNCGCGLCATIGGMKSNGNFKEDDIKYELLLTGREDTTYEEFSVPFFGFVDVETPPFDLLKDARSSEEESEQDYNSKMFWKISGNKVENSLMTNIPFPKDPTTWQYVRGYYHPEHGNQNKFYWGATNKNTFDENKNNVRQLWITRKYQTPENVELSNTFEPYYHSKVEFSQIPNLEKFVLNPARYGNGRNEFGEELQWATCTDMVGYYIGLYLSKDMSISGNKGSKIKTLIANDSSIDSVCTPMQYFNSSVLNDLEVLNVSNNELYRLSIDNNNKIKEIRAENNKLGHTTGTSWINAEGYPDTQEHFPMYRLSKIQRLILSNNDIKSLDTQSVKFNRLTSLIASNNPNLNNSKKLELNAPLLEYLDLSECGLGGGILLQNVPNIKQIILRDATQLGNTEDSFHFVLGKNTLATNLQALVLTNSRIRFLNLGASSQREWGDSGVVGIYNECGSEFLNLKYIDLSNNERLSKVELPKPSHSYSDSNKEYIEYLNVNGTSIGENVDEFFSQSAFNPNSYPKGHRLEVSARNITNLSGDKITLSLDKYNEIVNLWDGSEKFIILDVDIDK